MNVQTLLDAYAPEHDLRPSTLDTYRNGLADFEKWLGGPISQQSWDRDTVNRYLVSRQQTLRPHTVKQRRTTLRVFWHWGHESGLIDNPPGRLRTIKARNPRIEVWTPEQVNEMLQRVERIGPRFDKFLQVRQATYWSTFIRVAWDTGLRLSDQLKLRYADVTAAAGKRFMITQQKTGGPHLICVSATTLEWIEKLRREILIEIERPDSDLVFGNIVSRNTVGLCFQRMLNQIGGFEGTIHKLRKSSGTEVERICPGTGWIHLGHKSPATTTAWYLDFVRAYENVPAPTMLG